MKIPKYSSRTLLTGIVAFCLSGCGTYLPRESYEEDGGVHTANGSFVVDSGVEDSEIYDSGLDTDIYDSGVDTSINNTETDSETDTNTYTCPSDADSDSDTDGDSDTDSDSDLDSDSDGDSDIDTETDTLESICSPFYDFNGESKKTIEGNLVEIEYDKCFSSYTIGTEYFLYKIEKYNWFSFDSKETIENAIDYYKTNNMKVLGIRVIYKQENSFGGFVFHLPNEIGEMFDIGYKEARGIHCYFDRMEGCPENK